MENEEKRLSGRTIVIGFLVVLAIALVAAGGLRYAMRDRIREAQVKTMPTLAAKVSVTCDEPTIGKSELKARGRCSDAGTLILHASEPADGTRTLTWALLGADQTRAGTLPLNQDVSIILTGIAPGPHEIGIILADGPVQATELSATLAAYPANDVRERLATLESFVTTLNDKGVHARAERLAFEVEDAKAVH